MSRGFIMTVDEQKQAAVCRQQQQYYHVMKSFEVKVIPVSEGKRQETQTLTNFIKKYFLLVDLISCLDLGFQDNARLYRVLRAVNIAVRVGVVGAACAAIGAEVDGAEGADGAAGRVWAALNLVKHVLVVGVFYCVRQRASCAGIYADLVRVDAALGTARGCVQRGRVLGYVCCVTVLRAALTALSCLYQPHLAALALALEVLHGAQSYCLDFYIIAHFFIFYSIYCRLRNLRRVLNKGFNIYHGNLVYKALAEHMDEIQTTLDIPFVTSLVVSVLIAMINVLITLQMIHDGESDVFTIVLRYVEILMSFSLMFAPVILSDLMSMEANNIIVLLHNYKYATDEAEEQKRRQLCQFSHYVSCRPFRLRACRVLALDCTLPVTVLSVCVTYLIVVVQFQHLY